MHISTDSIHISVSNFSMSKWFFSLVLLFASFELLAAPRADVDIDDDGLIEIYTLSDLNNMRLHLDGAAFSDGADNVSNIFGCFGDAAGTTNCNGYELMNDLDFDTNSDGVMDSNDAYWNGGEGWQPIGDFSNAFTARFNGNYFRIRNLFINRPLTNSVGLFGFVSGADINALGLSGALSQVIGQDHVGGFSGSIANGNTSNIFVASDIQGRTSVGGLAGSSSGILSESFSLGSVSGFSEVGGLIGRFNKFGSNLNVRDLYSAATVTATDSGAGGLFGVLDFNFAQLNVTNSFARGLVTAATHSGALVGRLVSANGFADFNIDTSYWDLSGHAIDIGSGLPTDTSLVGNRLGLTSTEMTCPTGPDDMACKSGETLYSSWSNSIWDFGTTNQYPTLIFNGVAYHDTDNDGVLDPFDDDDDDDGFSDLDEGVCGTDSLDVSSVPADNDSDGLCDNGVDDDDDNDTYLDVNDAFPLDATEWLDTDNDGTGNNADTDDDNDTFSDVDEGVCGTDSLDVLSVPTDTDSDGLCDNGVDDDDDHDTYLDVNDAFPLDATEWLDTDNDGTGNNADTDDDNDTFSDVDEGICGTDSLDVSSVPADSDSDGLCDNGVDDDDDNDTYLDVNDAFPLDPTEWLDTDSDSIGNNADTDDDDDTFSDVDEGVCGTDPLDINSVPADSDSDGLCDNGVDDDDDNDTFYDIDEGTCGSDPLDALSLPTDTDSDGLCDAGVDNDDDNDSVADSADAFPLDPTESVDTDSDGIGNNVDTDDDGDTFSDVDEGICGTDPLDNGSVPTDTDGDGLCDNGVDPDDDNDGTSDANDAFPTDPNEDTDADGDGTGDNADTDDDNDGTPDASDAFPLDPNEDTDTDGDGTGNNADTDDDNDGTPDSSDPFPLDPTEDSDNDMDGIGDNADPDDDNDGVSDDEILQGTDPNNGDTDGDGVGDDQDPAPLDPTESVDTDGDGIGNNEDPDDDNDGILDADDGF